VRSRRIGSIEVDPGQPGRGELEGAALSAGARRDRAGTLPRPPDAGQAGHGY
jgi:hypothetical protein